MSDTGWKSPETVVEDSSAGYSPWNNPSNAKTSDNNYATVSVVNDYMLTHYLKATNFGFSIPVEATITGIIAEFEVSETVGSYKVSSNAVHIVKGGTIGSVNRADWVEWLTSDSYKSYGSASDLWGETWSVSDINSIDFGIVLQASSNSEGGTAQVDHIQIKVYYTEATGTPTVGTKYPLPAFSV